ncbi:MAG: hypothetical protein QM638_11180 [Nocardioides sp.]|uniref:electron transfer flavoprotein subunit beta/FixA family protein n=1 Tax=Nocardioides sp. TaxID=35761 RepID=UPI0039E26D12
MARPVNTLVCVKRVPDASSEVVLTSDGLAVDGRYVGYTISNHEGCAIELAVQIAAATGGAATALTLGPDAATDQLRSALSLGCVAAVHVVADAGAFGPTDVAAEIAAVVADHAAAGRSYDLILLGNDAADTGDFQVGIRLSYLLGRPVAAGIKTAVADESGEGVTASGDGPDGVDTYRLPTPAILTVLEGGVEPRYPTVAGRMRAKRVEIETRAPATTPTGPHRLKLALPAAAANTAQVLAEGQDAAAAAAAVVALLRELGVAR